MYCICIDDVEGLVKFLVFYTFCCLYVYLCTKKVLPMYTVYTVITLSIRKHFYKKNTRFWCIKKVSRSWWQLSALQNNNKFRFSGDWWLIKKKMSFFSCLRFIFACRLVLYLYACAVENPLGFCASKSEVCPQTINEWRKS